MNRSKKLKFFLFALLVLVSVVCDDESDRTGTFTDSRDGHVYKTIQIGSQVWMAENLAYRTSDSSWYYNDDSATYHKYGRLYNWNGAVTAVPLGWHLPTDDEWTILTNYLGGDSVAGAKLKEMGNAHWATPNTGATNEVGFTALPGGFRRESGEFNNLGISGIWWSATEFGGLVWDRNMSYDYVWVGRYISFTTSGFSVRCVEN